MRYIVVIIGAVLVNNFVLSRFLGCCPFLGVSKKTETAVGMSGAVVFVMTIAAAVTWPLDHYLLQPLGLGYIHTLVFILVIAALVQFIDIAMKRFLPPLHAALGIFLPLITTNCAVLGVAELNLKNGTPFLESVLFAFAERYAVPRKRALRVRGGYRLRLRARDLLRHPREAGACRPSALLPRRGACARHGGAPEPGVHGLQRACEDTVLIGDR